MLELVVIVIALISASLAVHLLALRLEHSRRPRHLRRH
jgi:hypothetical protein